MGEALEDAGHGELVRRIPVDGIEPVQPQLAVLESRVHGVGVLGVEIRQHGTGKFRPGSVVQVDIDQTTFLCHLQIMAKADEAAIRVEKPARCSVQPRFAGYVGLPELVIEQKVRERFDEDSRLRPDEMKIQLLCDHNLAAQELLVVQGPRSSVDGDEPQDPAYGIESREVEEGG